MPGDGLSSVALPREPLRSTQADGTVKPLPSAQADNTVLSIEALRRRDPADLLFTLSTSKDGLAQIKTFFSADTSPRRIREELIPLLDDLMSPPYALSAPLSPRYAQRAVQSILAGGFWRKFLALFKAGELDNHEEWVFASALRRAVCWGDQRRATLFASDARDCTSALETSPDARTRKLANVINQATMWLELERGLDECPGGRHDNDALNFYSIETIPTVDEVLAKPRPFLPRNWASEDDAEANPVAVTRHLGIQFRLLREDLVSDLREQVARFFWSEAARKGKRRGHVVDRLQVVDVHHDFDRRHHERPWALRLERTEPFGRDRHYFEVNEDAVLKEGCLVALIDRGEVLATGTAVREPALLARSHLLVELSVDAATLSVLLRAPSLTLVQAYDSPTYAYAPVLDVLRELDDIPLRDEILMGEQRSLDLSPAMASCVERIVPNTNVAMALRMGQQVILDDSQAAAMRAALTSSLSLVQGPPGTGKSFIGALVAKAVLAHTKSKVLVVCYTNHAVDTFLREILRIGVHESQVVRLGFGGDPQHHSLNLKHQKGRHDRDERLREDCAEYADRMHRAFSMAQRLPAGARREALKQALLAGRAYNESVNALRDRQLELDRQAICNKRLIACTTSGAAKYRQAIPDCDVVIVEEAGEVLESHVLTALQPSTSQLVLIGDHQQLRPKTRSFKLTVERGDGFDLNLSLFERLVRRGYEHVTLLRQHRMRPELSDLVRKLTYPYLEDAVPALESVKGLADNIVFIDHKEPESDGVSTEEFDLGASKQNTHEADVVRQTARHLFSHGHRDIVVLTPYLGQLYCLVDHLSGDFDVLCTGAMARPRRGRPMIRAATVDSFQGEEADIAIVSMTRSNTEREIGFMAFPQRVNVMLSRARLGLIVVANLDTFCLSPHGDSTWPRLRELVKDHIYTELPVA